ncbi:hypothetical protein DIQ79_24055 [Mycolicibacterium smegmatis]|uniref:Uncharacterized protein n=1 Tax=Mycolicibacterium smegmatis (strain ATCC 700084 / mc(2)155) TaxID=246196 RepID=A0R0N2_MYCS2|nr:hypothetical protein MSMEG_4445 [Mycolicibacterium smegmatis MC2 155]TBM40373.1 hypothetical protein DIQ86_25845 [Mycolicibacterium smegmatis]TBH33111.1 hypothetical protein EYS45_22765 [Mycolicibacterium smegmatis MC2 155]TBM48449.1 hypothetical protein DIQ85_24065 [Mycolicibacterium smegmatis]TBM58132.1 hypothetical protein DIQ83_23470 [Mycolicibacterium smegmatis]
MCGADGGHLASRTRAEHDDVIPHVPDLSVDVSAVEGPGAPVAELGLCREYDL